jgi:hypothetical protein
VFNITLIGRRRASASNNIEPKKGDIALCWPDLPRFGSGRRYPNRGYFRWRKTWPLGPLAPRRRAALACGPSAVAVPGVGRLAVYGRLLDIRVGDSAGAGLVPACEMPSTERQCINALCPPFFISRKRLDDLACPREYVPPSGDEDFLSTLEQELDRKLELQKPGPTGRPPS